MSKFNDANYQSLNSARWSALDTAALFSSYKGVQVLDLGAGDGVFSDTYFTPKGAVITAIEARNENLLAMELDRPHLFKTAQQLNLENAFPRGKWDMCLCVGLLYHLQTPADLLTKIAKAAPILFLETVIWQRPDESGLLLVQEAPAYDQAYSGYGCRPSVEWLGVVLKSLYKHVYAIPVAHPAFNGGNPDEQRVIRVASQKPYAHLTRV